MKSIIKKIKNIIKKHRTHHTYSFTFNKMGHFFFKNDCWWFCPDDNSFTCGMPDSLVEWGHGNPLFD